MMRETAAPWARTGSCGKSVALITVLAAGSPGAALETSRSCPFLFPEGLLTKVSLAGPLTSAM